MSGPGTPHQRRVALIAVAVAVVGWVVWSTRHALVPFVIGGILAYLLAPLVDLIQRQLPTSGRVAALSRPLAILITYAFTAGVLVTAAVYLIPPVVQQATDFVLQLPRYWDDIQRQADSLLVEYHQRIPPEIRSRVEGNIDLLTSEAAGAIRQAMMVTVGAVGTVVGVVAGLALLPLWLFYVLKDQKQGAEWFYGLWPPTWRADVRRIVAIVDAVLGAYIRVQLLLGVIIGVVTGLAMWLIGISQPLMLGVVAGVFELIPVLGPWLAFVVAALVTLATEPDRIILVGLAFLGIQQLENTFLVPKLQGDAVRIHPAFVMVLLVIGGALWGLWGMIVIVPLTAVVRDLFVYLYRRFGEEDLEAAERFVAELQPDAVGADRSGEQT